MRRELSKLRRGKSTKAERRFSEILKELKIPFRTKVKIAGREVDFLIGRYAIDLDAHEQDVSKNWMLVREGYHPAHFSNKAVQDKESIKKYLLTIHVNNERN